MPTSGTSFSNHGMRRRESSGHYRFTMSLWQACRLLLGFLVLVKSQAQDEPQIGVDICFCAPASYEFTLDFSLFCPPVNITQGDAVASTTCFVQPKFIEAVSDLIPVAVSRIIILELNQQQSTVSREEIVSSLGDGGTFQYTSLVALPGEVVDVTRLPRAIQLNIDGVNSLDEAITNIVTVTFTNNCGRYPVFFEGQSAGWVRFSDLQPPVPEFCPPEGYTEAPTFSPTSTSPAPTTTNPAPSTPAPSTPPPTTNTTSTPPPTPVTTLPPTVMIMSMSMSMDLGRDLRAMDMDFLSMISEMEESEFGRTSEMKEKSAKGAKPKKEKAPASADEM